MSKPCDIVDYEKISQIYSEELDVIYSNYKKILYFMIKRGLSHEDAQDAAQDTYVEAISCLPSLIKKEAVVKWLFTIATRVCNKYLAEKIKKNNNEVAFELYKESSAIGFAADVTADERMEGALGISREGVLYRNLLKLGDVERRVLILYYVYRYNYRDIALRLQLNHSTVRSISKRSKEKLRRFITEDELNNMI